MTFKASVSRNACSIPDAIVFAATASPKARALRVTPLPLFWVNLMHDNGLCHA